MAMESVVLEKVFSSRSSSVEFISITKKFSSHDGTGEFTAVNSINLEIKDGELTTLLGPSGCGKTTTLRMLAGFENPSSGEILLGGKSIVNTPPNKRDISMMFQSYALFPHLTIYENICYGLRLKKLQKSELQDRTKKVLELMQLGGMENRFPSQVSGGQQQRVALARAIVIEPRVLLFDEPLSNLDAKLREYMRDELRKLQQRLGITSLYVTHDQTEAMAISDKIVIMDKGNIVQEGTPKEIYEFPNTKFVANFIGKSNFIECKVLGKENGNIVVEINGTAVKIPKPGKASPNIGSSATMAVRPESIRLSKKDEGFEGIINEATYYGNKVEYVVSMNGLKIVVENYNPQFTGIFTKDENIKINFDLECVRLLENE